MVSKIHIVGIDWNRIVRLHSHGRGFKSHLGLGFFRVYVSPRMYIILICCCYFFERRKEKSSGKLFIFIRANVGIWSLCFLSWSGSFGKSLELSKKNRAVRVVYVIVVLLVDLMIMNDPFSSLQRKGMVANFHRPF